MADLGELYQEILLEHNSRPKNFRQLEDATATADGFNPLCGDQISLYLKVEDDLITDVAVEARGCAISTASASMMTESIKGKSIEEAKKIFETFRGMVTRAPGEEFDGGSLGDLEVLAGVSEYPARIKCATLSWHTLQSALLENQKVASTE